MITCRHLKGIEIWTFFGDALKITTPASGMRISFGLVWKRYKAVGAIVECVRITSMVNPVDTVSNLAIILVSLGDMP